MGTGTGNKSLDQTIPAEGLPDSHVLVMGKDATGIERTILVSSSGQIIPGILKEVRVAKVIDASLGAYVAGDVVGEDDCCTTLAIPWEFDVARVAGGYFHIVGAVLINETENQAVQYDLFLFNATPTGELRDNAANTNPVKEDRSKFLGVIEFPYSVAKGASVATYTEATPSTVGRLPKACKCAAGTTKVQGVLVTNTAYTQTATDDIEIVLLVEQY